MVGHIINIVCSVVYKLLFVYSISIEIMSYIRPGASGVILNNCIQDSEMKFKYNNPLNAFIL